MNNVNDLAKELLRYQENYRMLDAENDRLRKVATAAEEFCDAQRRGFVSSHVVFQHLARLDGAVQLVKKHRENNGRKR